MAPTLTEIVGTRKEKVGHKIREGTMLYVTTSIAAAPALTGGTSTYQRFAVDGVDVTTAAEDTLMGRRAFHNDIDIDTLPGVVFVATHYKAFVAHA